MILIKNKNGFISGKAIIVYDTFVEVCQKTEQVLFGYFWNKMSDTFSSDWSAVLILKSQEVDF